MLEVVQAAGRSTRGSTSAVHRPVCTAVRPAAVDGGTVCDGMVSSGCGGSNRADGADHRDTRTDSGALAGNGPAPEVAAVGTED